MFVPLLFSALLNFCCQSSLPVSLGDKFSNLSVTSGGHGHVWLFVDSPFSRVPVSTLLSPFPPLLSIWLLEPVPSERPHSLSHILPIFPSPPPPSLVSFESFSCSFWHSAQDSERFCPSCSVYLSFPPKLNPGRREGRWQFLPMRFLSF